MSETLNSPFQDHWYIWLSANASIALERTLQFSWLSNVLDLVMKLNKWSQCLNFCGALCLLRHTSATACSMEVSSSCERVLSPKNSHWYQVQEAASWQVFSVYRHRHVRSVYQTCSHTALPSLVTCQMKRAQAPLKGVHFMPYLAIGWGIIDAFVSKFFLPAHLNYRVIIFVSQQAIRDGL